MVKPPLPLAVRDEGCGFEGNSDLYGLGIRLGIYMQWLSTFVTDFESLTPLWETYSIFIFAIFIAILVLTAEQRPTNTAEMSILAYIIFGGAYTMVPADMRKASGDREGFLNHYVSMDLTSGAVACYFFWFWLRGMQGDNFLVTPCGSHGFLFAKVSLSDQHVTNIFAAASAIYAALTIGNLSFYLVARRQLRAGKPASPQPDTTKEERVKEP